MIVWDSALHQKNSNLVVAAELKNLNDEELCRAIYSDIEQKCQLQ